MKRGEESFPKSARLRHGREFRQVLRAGDRFPMAAFTLHVSREDGSLSRLGLIVPRRIGNAVTRNRVKRVLREVFRRSRRHICPGTALVIRVAPPIANLPYSAIDRQFREAVRRAGILESQPPAAERSPAPPRTMGRS